MRGQEHHVPGVAFQRTGLRIVGAPPGLPARLFAIMFLVGPAVIAGAWE
jgi:hypothetical protein